MSARYAVVDPVPNGYAYFNVIDRESEVMPNFPMVIISERIPDARDMARLWADRLNAGW
jgi:hypothetical protein